MLLIVEANPRSNIGETAAYDNMAAIISYIINQAQDSIFLPQDDHSPQRESFGMRRRDPHIVRPEVTIRMRRARLHQITTQSEPSIGSSL
jgi:hypothetical protein